MDRRHSRSGHVCSEDVMTGRQTIKRRRARKDRWATEPKPRVTDFLAEAQRNRVQRLRGSITLPRLKFLEGANAGA